MMAGGCMCDGGVHGGGGGAWQGGVHGGGHVCWQGGMRANMVSMHGGRGWHAWWPVGGGACMGYDEIRSMSGRYASYWNAFLF